MILDTKWGGELGAWLYINLTIQIPLTRACPNNPNYFGDFLCRACHHFGWCYFTFNIKGIAVKLSPRYFYFLGRHLGRKVMTSMCTNLSFISIVLRIATCDANFGAPNLKKGQSENHPFPTFPQKVKTPDKQRLQISIASLFEKIHIYSLKKIKIFIW